MPFTDRRASSSSLLPLLSFFRLRFRRYTRHANHSHINNMPNVQQPTGQDWGAVNVGRAATNRVVVPKTAIGVSRAKVRSDDTECRNHTVYDCCSVDHVTPFEPHCQLTKRILLLPPPQLGNGPSLHRTQIRSRRQRIRPRRLRQRTQNRRIR